VRAADPTVKHKSNWVCARRHSTDHTTDTGLVPAHPSLGACPKVEQAAVGRVLVLVVSSLVVKWSGAGSLSLALMMALMMALMIVLVLVRRSSERHRPSSDTNHTCLSV
jgi:hypothetical protein